MCARLPPQEPRMERPWSIYGMLPGQCRMGRIYRPLSEPWQRYFSPRLLGPTGAASGTHYLLLTPYTALFSTHVTFGLYTYFYPLCCSSFNNTTQNTAIPYMQILIN